MIPAYTLNEEWEVDREKMSIDKDKNTEDMIKENRAAMDALLRVPIFEEYFIWEQQQAKPKFKSASMTVEKDDRIKNKCTRCGMTRHDPIVYSIRSV